jgi:hypothetical protein
LYGYPINIMRVDIATVYSKIFPGDLSAAIIRAAVGLLGGSLCLHSNGTFGKLYLPGTQTYKRNSIFYHFLNYV